MISNSTKESLINSFINRTFIPIVDYKSNLRYFRALDMYLACNKFKLSYSEISDLIEYNNNLFKSINRIYLCDRFTMVEDKFARYEDNETLLKTMVAFCMFNPRAIERVNEEKKETKKENNDLKNNTILVEKNNNKLRLIKELKNGSQELRDFYNYVTVIKTPTLEEDIQLMNKIRNNNQDAKRYLIESHLKIAFAAAIRNIDKYPDYEFEDLVQEACRVVTICANYYDERRGLSFSQFVLSIMDKNLSRYCSHNAGYLYKEEKSLKTFKNDFVLKNGRKPTLEEIERYLRQVKSSYDLEEDEETIDNEYEVEDETVLDDLNNLEDEIETNNLLEDVKYLIDNNSLKDREKSIIIMSFGLEDGEEQTLEKISEKLGVSRERVRQVGVDALKKLRRAALKNELEEYLDNPEEIKERCKRNCSKEKFSMRK